MSSFYGNYKKMLFDALETVDEEQLEIFKNEIISLANKNAPILICGNGGSAAIAEHFSCDFNKGVCCDTELKSFFIPLQSNVSLNTANVIIGTPNRLASPAFPVSSSTLFANTA